MFQLQFDRYEPVWRWKKYSYTSATQLSAAYTVSLARYLSAFFFYRVVTDTGGWFTAVFKREKNVLITQRK